MSRPPFAYYGGKTRLADDIAALLPAHGHYVEPFAGSLAVLLAKPRSAMETVNDLDQDLMTFWRVLRDRPQDLARAIELTPHARAEHAAAYDLNVPDDFYRNPGASTYSMPDYLAAYADRIPPCARRLHGVSLECRDALEVITDYGQHEDVLLYCDPPYLRSVRNSTNYRHEMAGDGAHVALAAALEACNAAVVLSGYDSPLYRDLYAGWHRVELAAWTGNGIRNGATKTDGDRVEVLWSNRPLGEPHLFSEATA